jgi:hypothetical protein
MARSLEKSPLHLGLGATAVPQPQFTGMDWYQAYGARHAADGRDGRLVTMHTFAAPWESWEMHPEGSEVVLCTAGEIELLQEIEGREVRTTLHPGEYAINEPGVWHTANVSAPATAVFITAGIGTQHRSR